MNQEDEPFTETSFAFILEDTLSICESRMKDSDIQFEGPIYDMSFECRPTQISQILLNLINNSMDAISGNNIKWIRVDLSKSDTHLWITVSDSGAKIAEDLSEKMMNPFFTTKPRGQGTGLGLSISKKIALAHGGDLLFDNKDAINKFILKLPLTQK
jgi:C4-dicarboxylate-specific signal transduction histidine kinase